jgi:hypothetical protein
MRRTEKFGDQSNYRAATVFRATGGAMSDHSPPCSSAAYLSIALNLDYTHLPFLEGDFE